MEYAGNSILLFILAAIEAPAFSASSKGVALQAEKPLQLTPAVNPFTEPVGAIKIIDPKEKGIAVSEEKGQCTLKIDFSSMADAGEYTVTLKNPSGSASFSGTITPTGFRQLITYCFRFWFLY